MATMDLSNEIVRLRAELESVITQRDLLLCEVAALRRELEMSELRQLQDESFQRVSDDAHLSSHAPDGSYYAAGGAGAGRGGIAPPPLLHHHYHNHHQEVQHHSLHYQNQQMIHVQRRQAPVGMEHSQQGSGQQSGQHMVDGSLERDNMDQQSYIEGTRYVSEHTSCSGHPHLTSGLTHSNSSCSANVTVGCDSPRQLQYHITPGEGFGMAPQMNVHNRYEMSQDLLDKQIEILERKYGGLRARKAALVIQRAFRRYTLIKKFSAITAMAKASEKRVKGITQHANVTTIPVDPQNDIYANCQNNGTSDKLSLSRPMRSMSLRERHDMEMNHVLRVGSPNQNEIDAMAARVQHSAQQLNMMGVTTGVQPASSSSTISNNSSGSNSSGSTVIATRSDRDSGVCNSSVSGSVTNISTTSLQNDSSSSLHHQLNNSGSVHSSPNPSLLMWSNNTSVDGCYNNYSPNGSISSVYYDRGPIYGNMLSSGGKPLSSPSLRQQQQSQLLLQQQQAMLAHSRRVPPEVPKRTSSITLGGQPGPGLVANQHGSMSSVQSSGSDSSSVDHQRSTPHQGYDLAADRYCSGAVWKRQTPNNVPREYYIAQGEPNNQTQQELQANLKVSETIRKRQYRVGLNLFNKKPERGVGYLIRRGFLEHSPRGVARFLITRKGLSKQMIGEYLGNLQNPFNMAVLQCFVNELDLSGMQVDVALRKFQAYFRLPGEAQKIERLVEVFSRRYCMCNTDLVQRFRTRDTIFVLAFAIIMLNTDLHTPNLKAESRMSIEDFIKNLRGIDDCGDIERDMLVGIYERVKSSEFKPASDHVTQVLKVQATIVGKKPQLALPHRRLVCYCRLYEIPDINKKERPGVHQREVFLFNDLLVVTKIFSKKKSSVTYTFRQSFPLCGMNVTLFSVPHYPFGIRLTRRVDGRTLVAFNARNEHDRAKFAEDLRESAAEMDEMEAIRIETELAGRSASKGGRTAAAGNSAAANRQLGENRDSGVADVELDHHQGVNDPVYQQPYAHPSNHHGNAHNSGVHHTYIKRNVLSNSLVDINDPVALAQERLQRRGSVGSLDSGMSVSFHHSPSSRALHPPPTSSSGTASIQNNGSILNGSGRTRMNNGASTPNNVPSSSSGSFLGNIMGSGSSGGSSRGRRERGGSVGGQDSSKTAAAAGKMTEV